MVAGFRLLVVLGIFGARERIHRIRMDLQNGESGGGRESAAPGAVRSGAPLRRDLPHREETECKIRGISPGPLPYL